MECACCQGFMRRYIKVYLDCYQIQNKITELKANDIDPFLKEYLLKNNYDFKLDKDNYKLEINKKN